MFTWICPQCGREVPPAYTECPDCTKRVRVVAAPPPSAQAIRDTTATAVAESPSEIKPLAPPIEPELPPVAEAAAPVAQARPVHPVAPRRGLPAWLAVVLSTLAIAAVVAGVYWVVNSRSGRAGKLTTAEESPGAKPGAAVSPIQKFIEISSVRFLEDPKNKDKVVVKFVVTNHAEAELNGLAGNVTIWASTGRSEEDAEGTFEFSTNLKGLDSKELTAPLIGKKKIYELPDWQNMTSDVQITAPAS
jgi:hypothetical protein